MCSLAPPRPLSACRAVTKGDARDGARSDPKKVILKLHFNRGRASAQQIKRVLVDSEWGVLRLLQHADEVLEHRYVCQAFDRAPHVPIVGTSTVLMFNTALQVDLLFLGDIFCCWVISPVLRCLVQDSALGPSSPQASPRSMGRVLEFMGRDPRGAEMHSDG